MFTSAYNTNRFVNLVNQGTIATTWIPRGAELLIDEVMTKGTVIVKRGYRCPTTGVVFLQEAEEWKRS